MKNSRFTLAALALVVVTAACKKDVEEKKSPSYSSVESTTEMKVPSNFNFETDREVNFSFNLEQPPMNGKYRIEVYDFVPTAGRGVVQSAFVGSGSTYNGTMRIPSAIDQLYVVTYAPDGSSFTTVVPVSGNSVSHTFYKGKTGKKTGIVSTDCNSGCDQNVSGHSGWWNADDKDEVYCVTGNYNGGGINIKKGATVRLCGTGNIGNISIDKGVLEITSGADVTINNLSLNSGQTQLIVHNGATLTTTNWFSPNSEIYNAGTMNVTAFNLNSNSDLENVGTFNITGNQYTSFNGDVENNGTMFINHILTLNGSSEVVNNCTFLVGKDMTFNGKFFNHAFLEVEEDVHFNGSGRLFEYNGAMALFGNLSMDGKIEGFGSSSLVKVLGTSTSNSSADIKGNIEFCDVDGIEGFASNTIRDGAVESCDLYIPTSSCNSEGNGTPAIADADGDGVADNLDAYPNDGSRAANSYYPSENQFGTLGFEDLWPSYGDYDFNDLVVDYRHQYVLNANNNVVDLKSKFVTRAIGGSFENGFGFQLDVNSGDVSSVSGTQYTEGIINTGANGTESGQSKATIIVYDNAYEILQNAGGSFVNTVEGNPYVTPDTMEVTVAMNSPVSQASMGDAPFNPFIFVDGERGREVHLAGAAPTALADNSYFGTAKDNTTPGSETTYKSVDNLPWAINVTTGFSYPEEKIDIVQVYSLFSNWAQSGGLSDTDWHQDNPGYIDSEKLYQN